MLGLGRAGECRRRFLTMAGQPASVAGPDAQADEPGRDLRPAFATSFRLSCRVLRGNVASALAGVSAMPAGSCPARAGGGAPTDRANPGPGPAAEHRGEFVRADPLRRG